MKITSTLLGTYAMSLPLNEPGSEAPEELPVLRNWRLMSMAGAPCLEGEVYGLEGWEDGSALGTGTVLSCKGRTVHTPRMVWELGEANPDWLADVKEANPRHTFDPDNPLVMFI